MTAVSTLVSLWCRYIITRNTHAQSMPRTEEYPEICKSISVVTTCIVQVPGVEVLVVGIAVKMAKPFVCVHPVDIVSSSTCRLLSSSPWCPL